MDEKLAHVRHIEYADALTHPSMFVDYSGILHGHFKTRELNEFCSQFPVDFIERRFFHLRVDFFQSARNLSRPMSVSGCFIN